VRGFEALTVEALRELREEKDREIAAIKARNAALEKRLDHLEKLVSTLARAK
jgi:cell division protein FtsB